MVLVPTGEKGTYASTREKDDSETSRTHLSRRADETHDETLPSLALGRNGDDDASRKTTGDCRGGNRDGDKRREARRAPVK